MIPETNGGGATWIGRSIRRVEDPALVTGQGRFTADLQADYRVRFVRSPAAAGKIERIEAPAGAMVITAKDLTGVQPILPMLHKFAYRAVRQPILADGEVRYVGEPIAAVVARSAEQAEDISDDVEVFVSDIVPLVDFRQALAAGARQIHPDAPNNVIVEGRIRTPDFDVAWESAANIVSVEVRSRRQNATPIEPRAAHASYDRGTGRITLTCTTQMPHLTRTAIADALEMHELDLRVIAPDVGGGFGQKMSLAGEYVLLVWLARKMKASVAWTEDRRENLIASFHSRDQFVGLQGAFNHDGKLIALRGDIVSNAGAYSCFPTTCAVEPLMGLAELPGPYDFRAYDCRARGVTTNTCTMAPYRGVSRPVITFALERLMDKAARTLGIGPIEMRRRNLVGTFPYVSATGLKLDEASYKETLEVAVKAVDLPEFRERQAESRKRGHYLGIGFATFSERTGYGSPAFAARGMAITPGWETVVLSMDPSGFVEARIGASPHGQGLRTTLSQIIADQLGVAPSVVRVEHGDTDRAPYGWGTFASRSLVICGGATLIAARKVRAKLLQLAAHMLEASPGDIILENGEARVAGTDRHIAIAKLAREAYTQTHRFGGGIEPGLSESGSYDPAGTFSNACHVAEVEVDVCTGRTTIIRYLVVEDAGRLINPMIADGQIHGGVAQGIGNALFEEITYDETGVPLTATLADYMTPTAHEIPSIELLHLQTPSTELITKAKGLGEGGSIGAPAAVINAINDALAPFNAYIEEMPATPQRVRAALRSQGQSA